jgi:hypothetical protein
MANLEIEVDYTFCNIANTSLVKRKQNWKRGASRALCRPYHDVNNDGKNCQLVDVDT